jgi:NADH dehydrogenase FAD-containing subunit
VPILAVGTHAPVWLQGSGLALSDSGHVLVNAFQQSTSHPHVFAAGDVATRADAPHPKSGVYAVRAGPPLTHNLLAAHHGQPLKAWHPPARTLNLLSCGAGHAIASWGPLHAEGRWVWRWKDRIDRAFMAKYTLPATRSPTAAG